MVPASVEENVYSGVLSLVSEGMEVTSVIVGATLSGGAIGVKAVVDELLNPANAVPAALVMTPDIRPQGLG